MIDLAQSLRGTDGVERGMTPEQTLVPLRWPGTGTLKAAREAIRNRSTVEIELPLEVHFALYAHLHAHEPHGSAENIDTSGGAELLAPIASVAGLEELGRLEPAVRRGHYRVCLVSPQPRLRLLPPA
jgi:hypothetical protein